MAFISVLLASNFVQARAIENAFVKRYEANQFKRISEFFTGEEVVQDRLIFRSNASDREGLYFVIETPGLELTGGETIELSVVVEGNSKAETLTFPIKMAKTVDSLWIGITGKNATAEKESVLAWRVALKNSSNEEIDSFDSFLWKLPQ